jgi:hypothetical protein
MIFKEHGRISKSPFALSIAELHEDWGQDLGGQGRRLLSLFLQTPLHGSLLVLLVFVHVSFNFLLTGLFCICAMV